MNYLKVFNVRIKHLSKWSKQMTHKTSQIIGDSWDNIHKNKEKYGEFIDAFYEKFLNTDPRYKKLFPKDMTKQKIKMAKTLSMICRIGAEEEIAAIQMQKIADRHKKYNLNEQDMDNFESALLQTLADFSAEKWNEKIENAWKSGLEKCVKYYFMKV